MATSAPALLAIIELLLRPEYSNDFLEECMEDANVEITDEATEAVDSEVLSALRELAAPFIAELPTELRERYADRFTDQ